MAAVDITQAQFNDIINKNNIVIVDFWAPWCGPCRAFAPVYQQVSEKYPDIVFAKVNTEDEQGLAGAFQIRSIPTLMIFREQVIVYAQPGSLPASALEELIGKAQTLDMNAIRAEIARNRAEKATAKGDEA